MKPGFSPLPKIVEPPSSHALGDAFASVAEPVAGDELGCGDDVDARFQNANQMVDVGEHLVVDHAVGFESDQRVDVVGRKHAECVDTAEFAHVAAHLVR